MPYALHSILPAMCIKDALTCGPVVFCTTRHLEDYPIEPAADDQGVRHVTERFRDVHGKPLDRLGLVLVPVDKVKKVAPEGLPRMCRDAVALCHITAGAMMNCYHDQRVSVCNSDYFEALPVWFREDRVIDHGHRPWL